MLTMSTILEWMRDHGMPTPGSTPPLEPLSPEQIAEHTEKNRQQDWEYFQELYGTENPLDGQAAAWKAFYAGREPPPTHIPTKEKTEKLLFSIFRRANPRRGDTVAVRQEGWDALNEWRAARKK